MASKASIQMGQGHVTLATQSGPLEAGLAAAGATFKSWGRTIATVGSGIAGAGAAMLAPFAAGLHVFVEMGSAMQDAADRSGLAVPALSELGHAAQQSGAEMEDLEKSLREMGKTIVEAGRGGAGAIRTLEEMGLALSDLQGMSRDQQFERFADALAGVDDPARRATLATELFGRSGSRLLPLLSGGAEGVRALREEARRLGISMSGEDASAAEALGDQFANLVKIGKMVAFNFGASIAPVVKQFATYAIDAAAAVSQFMRENRALLQIAFAVGAALVAAGAAVAALGGVFWAVGAAAGVMSTALGVVGGVFGLLKAAIMLGVPGMTAAFSLASLAVWAFSTAHAVGAAVVAGAMAIYTAVTGLASAGTHGFSLAMIGAWIWENILSFGTYALVTALGALVLVAGAAVVALGGFVVLGAAAAAVSALAFKFGELHESLGFLDDAIDWINELWEAFTDSEIIQGTISTFTSLWQSLSSGFDAVMQFFEDSGVNAFLGDILKVAVGVAAVAAGAVALIGYGAYLAYQWATTADSMSNAFEGLGDYISALFTIWREGAVLTGGYIRDSFRDAFGPIISLGGNISSGFSDAMGSVVSTVSDATSRITSSFSQAWSSTLTGFTDMAGGLMTTAAEAWGGIMSAFRAGDFALIWEIVKVTALIAWERISYFVMSTFYTWKDFAVETFHTIWASIREMFETGWAFIKVGWFNVMLAILDRWDRINGAIARAADAANPLLNQAARDRAEAEREDARIARRRAIVADRDQVNIDRDANIRAIQNAEAIRAGEAHFLAGERDDARAAGNQAAVAGYQRQLDMLNLDAWIAEQQRWSEEEFARNNMGAPGGPAGELSGGKFKVAGGFSAGSAFGMLGASSTVLENPLSRIARLEQQQLEQMAAVERAVNAVHDAVRGIARVG